MVKIKNRIEPRPHGEWKAVSYNHSTTDAKKTLLTSGLVTHYILMDTICLPLSSYVREK